MQVNVNTADKIVAVDGVALVCTSVVAASIAAIRWHGDSLYGSITPVAGMTGGGDFRDPGVVAPYVAAWRAAMQQRLDAAAAAATAEAAAYQKFLADEQARQQALEAAAKAPANAKAGK